MSCAGFTVTRVALGCAGFLVTNLLPKVTRRREVEEDTRRFGVIKLAAELYPWRGFCLEVEGKGCGGLLRRFQSVWDADMYPWQSSAIHTEAKDIEDKVRHRSVATGCRDLFLTSFRAVLWGK